MNGNWYPWSGDPELFKKAYQYVHDKVSQEYGACNITWVWNPDIISSARDYYPGDRYVDWVGIDGYNTEDFGAPWRSCSGLFSEKIAELAPLRKPIMIAEFGSDANDGKDEKARKPAWLSDCVSYFAKHKVVKAFVYFNVDKVEEGKAKKWSIASPESRASYRSALAKHRGMLENPLRLVCGKAVGDPPRAENEKPAIAAAGALPINKIEVSTFAFNRGVLGKKGSTYAFTSNKARDPGFGIMTGNAALRGKKYLKFDLKGSVTRHGQWARLIVQVYDHKDNDTSPSLALDPIEPGRDFSTVELALEGKIDKVKKVQFLLVTDKGSCRVEIKNVRFE